MKKYLALLLVLSAPVQAADRQRDCFRRIAFTESGGESLRDFAINAKAIVNLSRVEHRSFCSLISTGRVRAHRQPPSELRPYIDAILTTALHTGSDISNGANSWNRGRRPAHKGKVKRVTQKQVFYAKADYNL